MVCVCSCTVVVAAGAVEVCKKAVHLFNDVRECTVNSFVMKPGRLVNGVCDYRQDH